MSVTIIKASGQAEEFDLQKLVDSLERSGAPRDVAFDIARQVEKQISPASHTRHIYRLAKKLLRQYSHASCMRYSLKNAISSLGPSGYPFERYFGRVLTAHGYAVELNRFVKGYCVTHEVDILARKDNRRSVIECKYHTDGGKATDVKIALYVHSRFQDIRKAYARQNDSATVHEGWLVTNTRCTVDAIRYAECAGLKIVSWRYPEKESLARMIEEEGLYPVTILTSAKKSALGILFSRDFILARDIAGIDQETFARRSGLDTATALALKKEADKLCLGV